MSYYTMRLLKWNFEAQSRNRYCQKKKIPGWKKILTTIERTTKFVSINSISRLIQSIVKHSIQVHVCGCFSHIHKDFEGVWMIKLYQRTLLPSTQYWFISEMKIGYCNSTVIQNIGVVFDRSETRKWGRLTELVVVIARYKFRLKCLDTHNVEALREKIWNVKRLFPQILLTCRSLFPYYVIKSVESMRWRC